MKQEDWIFTLAAIVLVGVIVLRAIGQISEINFYEIISFILGTFFGGGTVYVRAYMQRRNQGE